MKKIAFRILILLLVFVFGVAGTSFLMNGEISNDTAELDNASFPEVMIEIGGMYVNRMFGYAEKMQMDFTRDSLTPMDTSKKITLAINHIPAIYIIYPTRYAPRMAARSLKTAQRGN